MADPLIDCQTRLVSIYDQMTTIMASFRADGPSSEQVAEWARWIDRALEQMDEIKETLIEAAFREDAAQPDEYRREMAAALDGLDGMHTSMEGMRDAFARMRPSLTLLEGQGVESPPIEPPPDLEL